ncbi:hypothetical protein BH23VER1_BH23VER1_04670 [soil metagenome]
MVKTCALYFAASLVAAAGCYWLGWEQGRARSTTEAGAGEFEVTTRVAPVSEAQSEMSPTEKEMETMARGGKSNARRIIDEVQEIARRGGIGAAIVRGLGTISQLEDEELQEALEIVETQGDSDLRRMLRIGVLVRLVESDAIGAMQYAHGLREADDKSETVETVLQEWAAIDPSGALKWFEENRTLAEFSSSKIYEFAFGGFASRDLADALDRVAGLADPRDRSSALSGIVGSAIYRPESRAEITEYLSQLEDPAERVRLASGFARSLNNEDSPAAAEWLVDQTLLTGDDLEQAWTLVSIQWARTEPEKAAAVAEGLNGDVRRGHAVEAVVNAWAHRDANAAAHWLSTLGTGADLDGGRKQLALAAVEKDPRSAFAWASAISNAQAREESLGEIFKQWHQTDPGAAAEGLVASDLDRAKVETWLREAAGGE